MIVAVYHNFPFSLVTRMHLYYRIEPEFLLQSGVHRVQHCMTVLICKACSWLVPDGAPVGTHVNLSAFFTLLLPLSPCPLYALLVFHPI